MAGSSSARRVRSPLPLIVLVLATLVVASAVWKGSRRHPYRPGDALAYLPAECPAGRIYADVPALWAAVGSDDLLGASRRGAELGPLVAAFDAAGIDLRRDVHDFGLCAVDFGGEGTGSVYVALGGALGGTGALARYKSIIQTLAHVDAASVVEERKSGVPYLVSKYRLKRVWIAMPAADVLVFSTEDVAKIDALTEGRPVSPEPWGRVPGTLASVEAASRSGARIHGRITGDGGLVVLEVSASAPSVQALDAAQLETLRAATVATLDRSALRPLSESVKSARIVLADGAIEAELSVPGRALGTALVALERDPEILRTFVSDLVHWRARSGEEP